MITVNEKILMETNELEMIKSVIMKTRSLLSDTISVVLRNNNYGSDGFLSLVAKYTCYSNNEIDMNYSHIFDNRFSDLIEALYPIEVSIIHLSHPHIDINSSVSMILVDREGLNQLYDKKVCLLLVF